MNGDEAFDTSELPQAHHYQIHFCGHCPHAHLVYFDERGRAMFHATISKEQAIKIAVEIEMRDPNHRPIRPGR